MSRRLPREREEGKINAMEVTDDYRAKIRLWAANPRVEPLPSSLPRLPPSRPQRFASHEEMNRWKRALIAEMARRAAKYG